MAPPRFVTALPQDPQNEDRPAQRAGWRPRSRTGEEPFARRIPPGRLVEIATTRSGAQTTTAVACVAHAQARGDTAAWVQPRGGSLYPPDLDAHGVDLDALVVVHVPASAGPHGSLKAAEILLRSGGFGMVVVDLRNEIVPTLRSGPVCEPKLAAQSRLFALARERDSSVLLLTQAGAQLGSLIALRVEPRRVRVERGRFAIEHHVLKDKTGLFGAFAVDLQRGPAGLV